jgi:hypothetical protein
MNQPQMRELFGARHRGHLACEEFTEETATDEQKASAEAPPATDAAAAAAEPATEDATVVMQGPLADVYSDALMKAFPKDPAVDDTGTDGSQGNDAAAQAAAAADGSATPSTDNLTPNTPEGLDVIETAVASEVDKVVLESQSIDAAVASSIAQQMTDTPPAGDAEYQTLYAVDETQITPEEVKDVTAILSAAEEPENVTVLLDSVVPAEVLETQDAAEIAKSRELAVSLESMVIALGGKVVHSFGDFVKAQGVRQAAVKAAKVAK